MPAAHIRPSEPYSILALGYDFVMDHVDYEGWADYIYHILSDYHPEAKSVLELGCGTAMLAVHLQPLGQYRYLATDQSEAMVRVARQNVERTQVPVKVGRMDFIDFELDDVVDVVLLLYDGMNYVLEEEELKDLLERAYAALHSGGVFIFDQSTPANSLNNEADFEDSGEQHDFSYVRTSRYDPETQLHTTHFDLEVKGQQYVEQHVQRAYDVSEVRDVIQETRFQVEATFDGFTDEPAHDASERVHWILRKEDSESL